MCLLFSPVKFYAQTPADSLAIEKACRDYVEGWAEGDAGRVALGVSPKLVKTANTKYGFFDYCQLAKVNGKWTVMNVLWGYLPSH